MELGELDRLSFQYRHRDLNTKKHPRKLGRKKGNQGCLLLDIKILHEASITNILVCAIYIVDNNTTVIPALE